MSCAIQTISENHNRMIDVPEFINKFEKLPDDIINKILKFAYPTLDYEFKKSIKIVSTHITLNRLINEWLKIKDVPISYSVSWYEFIQTTECDMIDLFHNLKNCGCCERHSNGVYYNSEGKYIQHFKGPITGDFTTKKKHNKTTPSETKCTCCCRHHMRQIARCFPVF